jgi:hypothetical protein
VKVIEEWTDLVAAELGVRPKERDRNTEDPLAGSSIDEDPLAGSSIDTEDPLAGSSFDEVLALARYVARDVCGPAAPLTFYLMGVAVGRGMPLVEAAARVSTLVERWRGVDWRD